MVGRAAESATRRPAPQTIGPYRLVSELGKGGMGTVYLAERDDDEYKTAVAIKVLHGGLETPESVARFRDERQIMASLKHPGIVSLLDGGSTEDRLPYLVMEYVVGAPLLQWADAQHLDVIARVKLFRKVCAAVAFAHQKLVVHRDIKPGNILVTNDGEPKLVDFGIAKLLDPTAGREASTRTGMRLLTPEYASPEQVRGEPVTTATDVYALGAVLYELLAGAPPQQLTGEGIEGLRLMIEAEPRWPSVACPVSRRRAIAGDLDNVILKALQKEVAQRYASVEQFSEDLGRYLDGLPVLARASTWSYRVGKLVRRRRGVLAVALLVLASLSTAMVVSIGQARRADEEAKQAQKRFDEVRRLANSMLFEVDDKIADLEGATAARELIVQRALEYLNSLAAEADDDPALERDLATAYVKIGEIQGSTMVPNIGRPRAGLESYAEARRILDRLVASGHDDVATRWIRVRATFGVANLYRALGESAPMRASGAAALDLLSTLSDKPDFDYRLAARVHVWLHDVAEEDGDAIAAVGYASSELEVATRWAGASPSPSPEAQYWIACGHEARGTAEDSIGNPVEAKDELRQSMAILQRLVDEHPEDASYRRELWHARAVTAVLMSGLGDTHIWMPHVDDLAAAERELALNVSTAERMAAHDPGDSQSTLELVASLDELGAVMDERAEAATPSFERARKVFAGLSPSARTTKYAEQFERYGQCAMAIALGKQGRRAEALAAIDAGSAIAVREASDSPLDSRIAPAMCLFQAAHAHLELGDPAGAAELLGRCATELKGALAARPSALMPYIGLTETLELEARLDDAARCALLDEAVREWRSWPGTPTAYTRARQADLEAIAKTCAK